MLVIDDAELARATEALMIAAVSAKDMDGLKVHVALPRMAQRPDNAGPFHTDWSQLRAIALAAIVSLTGQPCVPKDQSHLVKIRSPFTKEHD